MIASVPALAGAMGAMVAVQNTSIGEEIKALTQLPDMIRWTGVAASLVLFAGAWLLLRLVDGIAANLANVFVQHRMLLEKLRALLHFSVYLVTIVLVVLLSFRFNNAVLTLLGGTVAVALGFAFKDLATSLIAGVVIMIDQPFQVGDRVRYGEHYGDVKSIGLRSVRMTTLDNSTVTIPNNLFLAGAVSSGNSGALDMMVVIDFHIGADQDVGRARDLVREAAATSRYVYLAKPLDVLVSQVVVESYVAVRLRLQAYVFDTRYEKLYESDVTQRVLSVFAKNDVAPPAILHRTVADRDAALAAAEVRS
ncbi:MAG: mechanosensitive ion channel [Planctomycetota bacterium]|nr:mechanosensitive ion channel [Planctomycetota bacterium]